MLGKRTFKDNIDQDEGSECSKFDNSQHSDRLIDRKSNKSQRTEMNQVCVKLDSLIFEDSDDEGFEWTQ